MVADAVMLSISERERKKEWKSLLKKAEKKLLLDESDHIHVVLCVLALQLRSGGSKSSAVVVAVQASQTTD